MTAPRPPHPTASTPATPPAPLPAALTTALAADAGAMLATYRHHHAHPELSMQETATAAGIEATLTGYGYSTFRCAGTGVVAVLENGAGPVVAYRADIDGLPIEEATGVDFASTARGTLPDGTETFVMHGCGHDTHITTGLETAKLLAEHRSLWAGTVVFLFQPGEETAAGAAAMVADGLWDKAPRPEAIFGQHVWPGLAGTVDLMLGTAMATADSLEVTVLGKQAHGSQPENSIDPIVLGAFMVTRLQTIVARELGAQESAVVTIGSFHAGLKENIIPDRAVFTLNVRTFDAGVRTRVNAAIRRIVAAEAAAAGAPEPQVRELYQFPPCENDPALAAELNEAFRAELGDDAVINPVPRMGSEDFGAFGQAIGVPYVFWFFGANSAEQLAGAADGSAGAVPGNHSPFFIPTDIEKTLETGVRAALTALLSKVGVAA